MTVRVDGHGPKDAKIAHCGEQPGRVESRQKECFVGPAGRVYGECLSCAYISRSESYWTNVIKDFGRPLKEYIYYDSRRKIVNETDQYRAFKAELKEELEAVNFNVIVAVGWVALWTLCDRTGIYSWRGSTIESTLLPGRKVIPIVHPSTVLPPKFQYLNKHLIIMDLIRAKEQSEFPDFRLTPRRTITKPSYHDALHWLEYAYELGRKGYIIDYDIELYNEELSCFSIATSPTEAMSIAFCNSNGDLMTPEQEGEVMLGLAKILEDPNVQKRGQRVVFDTHFLLHKYGIRGKNLHCTQIAQKIAYPDYRTNLAFITSMHTDIPYYKATGKRFIKGYGTWEKFWIYNDLDSLACADAHPKQIATLKTQGNLDAYEWSRKLIEPCTYMNEKGTLVDLEGMREEFKRCEEQIGETQEKLNSIAGYPLNAHSFPQMKDYFYIRKNIKPYTSRKGKIAVDKDVLKRLARRGFEEARLIQKIRRLTKRKSTYLEVDKVSDDGRLRCHYDPSGTKTSRLSSSEDIFGKGGNRQNWPHDLLRFLLPDPGYLYYSFDESQIENRIVAYVGNIPQMIECFENKMDSHKLTAALIFQKSIEEVTTEDGTCPIGDGTHSERFFGKKANHAFNYGFGYKSFSLEIEISEKDGRFIHDRFHTAYPGVKQGYQQGIKNKLFQDRTLVNLYGRSRTFMDAITGAMADKTFREAYAQIPQSTAADKTNREGICYIYYNQQDFAPIELLEQVHDSIGFQIPLPPAVSWEEHARMLLLIKSSLETPLVARGREFIVPADLTIGLNLYKEGPLCREIKSDELPATVKRLARRLSDVYEEIRAAKEVPSLDSHLGHSSVPET